MSNCLIEMDEIRFRLFCGIEVLHAIYTAIAEGPYAGGGYDDALLGVYDHLSGICKELEEHICSGLAEVRGQDRVEKEGGKS